MANVGTHPIIADGLQLRKTALIYLNRWMRVEKEMPINEDKLPSWYQEKYGWFEGDFSGVKSKERAKTYAEVLTPRWLAEMMVDQCEPEISYVNKLVFEPACGEGAFITVVLRRKLERATTDEERLMCCQTCYGVDIQYDNVQITRKNLTKIAVSFGVKKDKAQFIFARNIVHGDMLFFPMIIRFYDWDSETWHTLEEMAKGNSNEELWRHHKD